MFGFRTITLVMTWTSPPGMEVVPFSCYSGSFRTWAFDNDIISEYKALEVVDDFIPEQREDSSLRAGHYFRDTSPETSKHSISDNHTFAEIVVQTETTL